MVNIVLLLEEAYAKYLGSQLKNCRVDTFADEFAGLGKPTQRAQLLLGHQNSIFNPLVEYPVVQVEEIANYEVRLEVVDLKNHRAALDLMSQVVAILMGYQPYTNVGPLAPVNYRSPSFNRASGIWTYTALFRTSFIQPRDDFELISDLPDAEVVSVGLFNSWTLSDQDAVLVARIPEDE